MFININHEKTRNPLLDAGLSLVARGGVEPPTS